MLKHLIPLTITRDSCLRCTFSQLTHLSDNIIENEVKIDKNHSLVEFQKTPSSQVNSILGPLSEDITHISTYLKPTFNFAAYANKSETLQEFVKLGVNLHYVENKINEAMPFILRLKFEDIKEHILFLNQLGVKFEDIGKIITKNPFIFKEKLEDFKVRINYLKYKKFDDDSVVRIISKNPFWLSHSTQDIDEKLGFFQTNFNLLGKEVRHVAVAKPQLITLQPRKIKLKIFVIKEEMGFDDNYMKEILLKKPGIFINGQHRLLKTFDYLHNVMKITHEQIVQIPEILTCREKILRVRHQFLKQLKRDQFDPKKPNYINLITMVKETDAVFATDVAKSSIEEYNMFLKTL